MKPKLQSLMKWTGIIAGITLAIGVSAAGGWQLYNTSPKANVSSVPVKTITVDKTSAVCSAALEEVKQLRADLAKRVAVKK